MAAMTSLAAEIAHAKRSAESIGESFTEPDAEWAPVMIYVTGSGEHRAAPLSFSSDEEKVELFERTLPQLLRSESATHVVLVIPVWVLDLPTDSERLARVLHGEKVADQPDKKEYLVVSGATALQDEVWRAEVLRSDDAPPRLGEWRKEAYTQQGGLMVEPLRRALALQG